MKNRNNKSCGAAKKLKNDEFYTLHEDIENELKYYSSFFEGKVVYCPCDSPEWSNFAKYFTDNFHNLKLKKLICSHCSPNEVPTSMVYDGKEKVVTELLNGSFNSFESVVLLKQSDIVVTNPPFSLWRKFFDILLDYGKDFIIIGPKNALGYSNVFPHLKNGRVNTGFNLVNNFVVPDHVEMKKNCKEVDEAKVLTWKRMSSAPALWFTTLPVSGKKPWLETGVKYDEKLYCKYVNCNAINVDEVKDIPDDYEGVMGVPISFWNKINREQFEVVGQLYGEKGMTKEFVDNYYANGGTGQGIKPQSKFLAYYNKEGKPIVPYIRLLIKRIIKTIGQG